MKHSRRIRSNLLKIIVAIVAIIIMIVAKNKPANIILIYTSKTEDISIIDRYNIEGKYIGCQNINIGGLTGGAFMKEPIVIQDKIYITSPILNNRNRQFITELDTNTLETRKINSEDTPTTLAVDDKYIYMGSSNIDGFDIYQKSLNEDIITGKISINGVGEYLICDNQYMCAISHIYESNSEYTNIEYVDKVSLKNTNTIEIPYVLDVKDYIIENGIMYLLGNYYDIKNETINSRVIKVDIGTNESTTYEIESQMSERMYLYEDKFIIVNQMKNEFYIYDNNFNNKQTINIGQDILSSYYKDGILYLVSEDSVIIYGLKENKYIDRFEIDTHKDMMIVGIILI